ncbi:MAG: hypothetical protein ACK4NS_00115 [Saprospiraceae bacterium]
MTEEKETQQPDELFRSILESLPDWHSPNGWDRPSAHVWNQIRRRIRPTAISPAVKGITALAVLAVAVIAYWQWVSNESMPLAQSDVPPTAQAFEQHAATAPDPLPAPPPAPALPQPAPRPLRRTLQPEAMPAAAAPVLSESEKASESLYKPSARRSEDMQTPKNTAELRRLELRKLAGKAWETELEPLPVKPSPVVSGRQTKH